MSPHPPLRTRKPLLVAALVLSCVASSASAAAAVAPTISISPASLTAVVGTAIPAVTPALSPDVVSVSISPALVTQTGLTFDSSTGALSGTPTAAHSATYTLTAVNAAGKKASATIQITVNALPPTISFGTVTSYTFLVGAKIATIAPTITNTTSVSIAPAVAGAPNITDCGLSFDEKTGKISGTPTTAIDQSCILTASNSTGQTATASITINLNNVVPPTAPPPSTTPGCEYTLSIADFQSTKSRRHRPDRRRRLPSLHPLHDRRGRLLPCAVD